MPFDYDPNQVREGYSKKIELTLGQWAYRKTFTVYMRGNVGGLNIMDGAAENLAQQFIDEAEADETRGKDSQDCAIVRVHLDSENGENTLEIDYDPEYDPDVEDWVKAMIVKAEIVDLFMSDEA